MNGFEAPSHGRQRAVVRRAQEVAELVGDQRLLVVDQTLRADDVRLPARAVGVVFEGGSEVVERVVVAVPRPLVLGVRVDLELGLPVPAVVVGDVAVAPAAVRRVDVPTGPSCSEERCHSFFYFIMYLLIRDFFY